MSVNKNLPHILVLPEDDADRQLANGFHLGVDQTRKIQVLEEAGGWNKVLECFESTHISEMDRYTHRFMVLLIDFDRRANRLEQVKAKIPGRLKDRVFILGVWSEPEDLRQAKLGSFETIGRALAEDCREGSYTTWGHDLLKHNKEEIERLGVQIRPILF